MAKYKRNPSAVFDSLYENKANQILTKVPCRIQVPVRFSERGLGQVGIQTFTLGLFPIILDTGEYAILNACALVELDPFKVSVVTINEIDYHEFYFEANQVVIKNSNIVRRDSIIYNIFDELIFKGKIPWYIEYEDLAKVFDTAEEYANSNVGQSLEVIEFIASMITRPKQDRMKYIREVAESRSDFSLDKIDYVPLASVFYSVKSTVNKIAGSYFNDGVVSALVNPSDRVENIEKILRA
jgi:hypothetical protein